MSDLIEREAVMEIILMPQNVSITEQLEMLKKLPSAEPEIIHCKDCRHNGSFDTDCPINWNGKEFCSFAER